MPNKTRVYVDISGNHYLQFFQWVIQEAKRKSDCDDVELVVGVQNKDAGLDDPLVHTRIKGAPHHLSKAFLKHHDVQWVVHEDDPVVHPVDGEPYCQSLQKIRSKELTSSMSWSWHMITIVVAIVYGVYSQLLYK